ncbi:hypothetical protein EWM64_g8279 [Hericium alpestre]|uniref:Uncharacterized protein n=1 Tax=Hericium alpestre TaxID=135208 RepID=A0A4Y9ZP06_9AGAM|nr:hypothetical protein EWM64_g8279 [Hericium alpestre]
MSSKVSQAKTPAGGAPMISAIDQNMSNGRQGEFSKVRNEPEDQPMIEEPTNGKPNKGKGKL